MLPVLFSWVSISLILCLALVRAAARRFVHSSNDAVPEVATHSVHDQDIQPALTARPSGRLVPVR
jgi:hypothetical protein